MSIDLKRFHQIFFDEGQEHINALEEQLLAIENGRGTSESIHTLFRAAHSLKGGSSTFGFDVVARLTHVMETLLHEFRSQNKPLGKPVLKLLFRCVDCLRTAIDALRKGKPAPTDEVDDLIHRLSDHTDASTEFTDEESTTSGSMVRRIRFAPHGNFFASGNDPLRIIRELTSLGTVDVTFDSGQIPAFEDLDPEVCHLAWTITLESDCDDQDIQDIFEWVEDLCDLEVTALASETDVPSADVVMDNGPEESGAESSIRVGVRKIDDLVNLVGEMIIAESRMNRLLTERKADEELTSAMREISQQIGLLQEQALAMRMVPVGFVLGRLPRLVRDLGEQLGKHVDLTISGESTEIDRGLLDAVTDSLTHLVRNAIDHGIEETSDRKLAGKPEHGKLYVSAAHQGGSIVIQIEDDGRGLDVDRIVAAARQRGIIDTDATLSEDEAKNLIFDAGFSTAKEVSDVSGRGVGLDVVRLHIQRMGGHVDVDSQRGRGTTFTIALPLTLSIVDGQLVQMGDSVMVVPALSIAELIPVDMSRMQTVAGKKNQLYRYRESVISLVDLRQRWNLGEIVDLENATIIILERRNEYYGLIVDWLLDQQQVVVKNIEDNFRRVSGLAGATILGDGQVALILDVATLGAMAHSQGSQSGIRTAENAR